MDNPQIKVLSIQYQRAMNNIDFLNEKFKALGVNPNQYLHERESYSTAVTNNKSMRKRLAALKLKNCNESQWDEEDCADKQKHAQFIE